VLVVELDLDGLAVRRASTDEVYTWMISQANATAATAPSAGNPSRKAMSARHSGSRRLKNLGRGRLTTTVVSATPPPRFRQRRPRAEARAGRTVGSVRMREKTVVIPDDDEPAKASPVEPFVLSPVVTVMSGTCRNRSAMTGTATRSTRPAESCFGFPDLLQATWGPGSRTNVTVTMVSRRT
jgi:hypothetical protein